MKAICDKSCAHSVGSVGVRMAVTALAQPVCGHWRACGSIRSTDLNCDDAFWDDDDASPFPAGQLKMGATWLCTLAADDLPHRVRLVGDESAYLPRWGEARRGEVSRARAQLPSTNSSIAAQWQAKATTVQVWKISWKPKTPGEGFGRLRP